VGERRDAAARGFLFLSVLFFAEEESKVIDGVVPLPGEEGFAAKRVVVVDGRRRRERRRL
jgi:hypothetical protein